MTKYSTELPSQIRPEEPLDCYSTRELEEWLVVRISADIRWKSKNVMPIFQRNIDLQERRPAVCLIPGGRWLLTGSSTGCVTAYDLESSDTRSSLLIKPFDKQDSQQIALMTVYIDENAHKLSFDIVLSPFSHRGILHDVYAIGYILNFLVMFRRILEGSVLESCD